MIARRTVLKGLAAGLPLAKVLADPALARAAAETTRLTKITTKGGQEVAAALAVPAKLPAPAVMLVHEWWGLNDQIKAVAADFANQGYLALAIDLYDGRVATVPPDAQTLMRNLDPVKASDTAASWLAWLSNHPEGTRKIGTCGWCMGGGWSLRASTETPVDATVVYYGKVDLPAEQLAKLKGPVLGHFATKDAFITQDMVSKFEAAMKQVGKPYEVHWYEADHAFANPTVAPYDQEDAQLAWQRTTEFLKKNLS